MKVPADTNAQRVALLYEQADRHLQTIVSEAIGRGADGTANYYNRQLGEVRRVLAEVQGRAIPLATEAVGQSYVQGIRYADQALGLSGPFAGVHREAIEVLVDNAVNKLGEAATTVGRQTEDLFRKAALDPVALGIASGETRKAVTRAIRENLIREGVTAFKDKGGRRWSLASYTKMVARTTTREAVSIGTANRLLENGHDLVTISSHSHETDECSPFQGKTFSMTGETSGYPKLERYPPFHPNCVHVLTPAEATFEEFEKAVSDEAKAVTPPVTNDPLEAATSRIVADMADFQMPSGFKFTLDTLAPNGLDDPDLDLPWAADGETKRERINSLISEAKAKDVDYLVRVGGSIEREIDALALARRVEIEDLMAAAKVDEGKALDDIEDATTRLLDIPALERRADPRTPAIEAERDAGQARYLEAGERWIKADIARRTVEQSSRLEILSRVRPGFGSAEIEVTRQTKVSELVKEQSRFMPREWIERTNRKLGKLGTKISKGRGVYYGGEHRLEVRERDGSNALHELTHAMEAGLKNLVRAERAFYKHRTDGEALVKLSDLVPGSSYKANELTRRDRFTNPYMGKDYGGDAYELLTMGMEGVFYRRHNLISATRPEGVASELREQMRRLGKLEKGTDRADFIERRIKHLEAKYPEGTDEEYVRWIMGVLATL